MDKLLQIPEPSWRNFGAYSDESLDLSQDWQQLQESAKSKYRENRDLERGKRFWMGARQDQVITAINAALYLRRPLLIEGKPGSGKTSLAYAIAYELRLGPVLLWPITTRSTFKEGLYQYDAIARLQDAQLAERRQNMGELPQRSYQDIGKYIRLGPVGTAFLPSKYPRVLLIDEIDKSDINLPNDLLNLFEEGTYTIVELERLAKQDGETRSEVQTVGSADEIFVKITRGKVQCSQFPLIVMTSNGERDFPPAFLRRCLRVTMPQPNQTELTEIVKTYVGKERIAQFEATIREFYSVSESSQESYRSTDQLLNMVHLCAHGADKEQLKAILFASLAPGTTA
ncbi:MAG: AAA family ATPase [Symploca sp. SIO2G7]|nr:AAA family ATPase [Symploca sp. SIO2G7]